MQCETCGKHFIEGRKVKLEGSIVVTCVDCARYGEVVGIVKPKEKKMLKPAAKPASPAPSQAQEPVVETESLIEGYGDAIRRAREKKGLKQEDLAKRLNEPTSLVHRLESGRFDPSDALIRKVQGILGVKLFEKTKTLNMNLLSKHGSKDLTLGDIVVVKKRDK